MADAVICGDESRTLQRAVRNLTRQTELALSEQHRYRIAFMLFAQETHPDVNWQELWVAWLMRANRHIGGEGGTA